MTVPEDDLLSGLASAINLDPATILDQDILTLLGADDLPEVKKEELYGKILATIRNRVLVRLLTVLNDQAVNQLSELIDRGEQAEIQSLLESQGVNLERLFLEEAASYKVEMATLGAAVSL